MYLRKGKSYILAHCNNINDDILFQSNCLILGIQGSGMKIAIIGAGKWGKALYHAYSQDNEVVISSRNTKDIENFVSMDEALKYEYLVMATLNYFVGYSC